MSWTGVVGTHHFICLKKVDEIVKMSFLTPVDGIDEVVAFDVLVYC